MERANEKQIELAELTDQDLAEVSGGASLSEMKAEARARNESAMAAATHELMLTVTGGIASATSAFASPGKHKA